MIDRARCWLVPMRPVTPFMMIPIVCRATLDPPPLNWPRVLRDVWMGGPFHTRQGLDALTFNDRGEPISSVACGAVMPEPARGIAGLRGLLVTIAHRAPALGLASG